MKYLFIILISIFFFGCLTQSPYQKKWQEIKDQGPITIKLKQKTQKQIDPKYCQLYKQSPTRTMPSGKTVACYIMTDGIIFDGEVSENHFNGKGIIHFIKGHPQDISSYFGDWVNSIMQGKGIITYKNDKKYIGVMQANQRHGIGILYDSSGNILKDGEWINNLFIEDIEEYKLKSEASFRKFESENKKKFIAKEEERIRLENIRKRDDLRKRLAVRKIDNDKAAAKPDALNAILIQLGVAAISSYLGKTAFKPSYMKNMSSQSKAIDEMRNKIVTKKKGKGACDGGLTENNKLNVPCAFVLGVLP